ncbi:hypothetical protein MTO96_027282 [Rhipicephalus appendiculatus]
MKRQLGIRRRTALCQALPREYDDTVIEFNRFVNALRAEHEYHLVQVGNADTTPVCFDAPENTTVNLSGAKSGLLRTNGTERQRCTVMVSVSADCRKLPPYGVFKRKTLPKESLPNGMIVRVQEKVWMSHELVVDWMKTVWAIRPGTLLQRNALLVLDSFRGHLTERVKARLAEARTHLAVIHGGLTSMLQLLDVSIDKLFKAEFRHQYSPATVPRLGVLDIPAHVT